MPYYYLIPSPIGTLCAAENGGKLIRLYIGAPPQGAAFMRTPLMAELEKQLGQYFAGSRKRFDIPFEDSGTAWQQSCYRALRNIPYGQQRTYKQLAEAAGNKAAARAAGSACHRNPLLLITPCHRILGANGTLTGFAAGLEAKAVLLRLEKENAF